MIVLKRAVSSSWDGIAGGGTAGADGSWGADLWRKGRRERRSQAEEVDRVESAPEEAAASFEA